MSSRIEDYALLGDGESAALLGRDGSIDWLCWPRFDSDTCFAGLLGSDDNGHWRIASADPVTSRSRAYAADTLVMPTDFETAAGAVRIIDFMPMRKTVAALVRIVVGLRGTVRMRSELRIRCDYGSLSPWQQQHGNGMIARVGPSLLALQSAVPQGLAPGVTAADFDVGAGDRLAFVLSHGPSETEPPPPLDAEAALEATADAWSRWIARFDDSRTRWPRQVRRSLLTLKGMIHLPTGSLVAAPTTSLPEAPGGSMNWDYRYCWLRDASFTVGALLNAGFRDDAEAWRDWLLRAIAGSPERMRIMYRVDGARHLSEWSADWLGGYRDARPVRIGNAAATQHQIDVYGEVLDCLDLARQGGLAVPEQEAVAEIGIIEHLERIWGSTGSGLWESRAEPRRYTYSKAMAWVAVDRFLKRHGHRVETHGALLDRLGALRPRIHEEVCREGFNEGLGCFTQYYGGQELDASLLLLPLVGFIPAHDPRMVATIEAIRRELSEGGLIRRMKRAAQGPDEGVFLACSCWMADCLNLIGRKEEAVAQFERVLAVANDLDLLSEEYDVPGRHLSGNFPQALTHLAVVNTGIGLCGPTLQRGGG